MIEVKGCDIKRVGIVAVEKRGKTRRNFSEVTNAFKNGMWFVVNVIFQLAGYCFRRKVLEGVDCIRNLRRDSFEAKPANGLRGSQHTTVS